MSSYSTPEAVAGFLKDFQMRIPTTGARARKWQWKTS